MPKRKKPVSNPRRRPLHVKKGDVVLVITGDEKGRKGKILRVDVERERVFVEGLAIQKRHLKARRGNEVPRIDERPGPIHVSNVRKVEG